MIDPDQNELRSLLYFDEKYGHYCGISCLILRIRQQRLVRGGHSDRSGARLDCGERAAGPVRARHDDHTHRIRVFGARWGHFRLLPCTPRGPARSD